MSTTTPAGLLGYIGQVVAGFLLPFVDLILFMWTLTTRPVQFFSERWSKARGDRFALPSLRGWLSRGEPSFPEAVPLLIAAITLYALVSAFQVERVIEADEMDEARDSDLEILCGESGYTLGDFLPEPQCKADKVLIDQIGSSKSLEECRAAMTNYHEYKCGDQENAWEKALNGVAQQIAALLGIALYALIFRLVLGRELIPKSDNLSLWMYLTAYQTGLSAIIILLIHILGFETRLNLWFGGWLDLLAALIFSSFVAGIVAFVVAILVTPYRVLPSLFEVSRIRVAASSFVTLLMPAVFVLVGIAIVFMAGSAMLG